MLLQLPQPITLGAGSVRRANVWETDMPQDKEGRTQFLETVKPVESGEAPDSEAPAKTAEPTPVDGEPVVLEGESTGSGGSDGGGGDAPQASTGGDGGDGGEQATEGQSTAKNYNFKVGGVDFNITDDGDAKVTVPEKKLWEQFGPKDKHSLSWKMPIPGIPAKVDLSVSANINYLLQLGDGVLQETTIEKRGNTYTIDSALDTSLHVGLGIGASASVGVDAWLIEAGAGIRGTASIGGEAAVKSKFRVEYNASTKSFKAAATVKTAKLKMPIEAKLSAFVYLDTIATSTWEASWSLIEANLGSLIVGNSKASLKYQSGEKMDFDINKPSFDYSSDGREISFFGKRGKNQ